MRLWSLLLLAAAPSMAQVAEFGVHAGTSNLSNNSLGRTLLSPGAALSDISLKDGWRFGFRMTLNTWRFFGNEFGYAYNRTQLAFTNPDAQQGMAIHQGGYNFLLYALPEGSTVRPFATGGGHFSNYTPPGSSATQGGGETKFGVNYGGGIKVKVAPLFLIRVDVRQYITPKPFDLPERSGMLRQLELSAGLSFVL